MEKCAYCSQVFDYGNNQARYCSKCSTKMCWKCASPYYHEQYNYSHYSCPKCVTKCANCGSGAHCEKCENKPICASCTGSICKKCANASNHYHYGSYSSVYICENCKKVSQECAICIVC